MPWSLANLCGSRNTAGDLTLGHPQVQQECGDLAVEVPTALVPQHRHQMQLEAFPHTAYLRLGKGWGKVGLKRKKPRKYSNIRYGKVYGIQ